ncbi:hypothetical protein BMMON3_12910 [Burkholderia mallei]
MIEREEIPADLVERLARREAFRRALERTLVRREPLCVAPLGRFGLLTIALGQLADARGLTCPFDRANGLLAKSL